MKTVTRLTITTAAHQVISSTSPEVLMIGADTLGVLSIWLVNDTTKAAVQLEIYCVQAGALLPQGCDRPVGFAKVDGVDYLFFTPKEASPSTCCKAKGCWGGITVST